MHGTKEYSIGDLAGCSLFLARRPIELSLALSMTDSAISRQLSQAGPVPVFICCLVTVGKFLDEVKVHHVLSYLK